MKPRTALPHFTAFSLGLFSGAMFLIALGLGRYWNSLPPLQYRESFQVMGPYLGRMMVPLLTVSVLSAALTTFTNRRSRLHWTAFVLIMTIVPLYTFIHGPINNQLLDTTVLGGVEISSLRERWYFWHWVRTVLGIGAFLAALRCLIRTSNP